MKIDDRRLIKSINSIAIKDIPVGTVFAGNMILGSGYFFRFKSGVVDLENGYSWTSSEDIIVPNYKTLNARLVIE